MGKQAGTFIDGLLVGCGTIVFFGVVLVSVVIGYYLHTMDEWDFRFAAEHGGIEKVRELSTAGVNIDASEPITGRTALMYASKAGHWEVIEILVKRGADIEKTNYRGATALHIAAQFGHIQPVKVLLDAGAEVDAVNRLGTTALMLSTIEGHGELVKQIVKYGADIYRKNLDGKTAWMYAYEYQRENISRFLMDLGSETDLPPFFDVERYSGKNVHNNW